MKKIQEWHWYAIGVIIVLGCMLFCAYHLGHILGGL